MMRWTVILLLIVTLFQFLVELALAAALQSLLFIWGLLPARPSVLDRWDLDDSMAFVLFAFIVIGTLKGLLLWASVFLAGSYGIGLEVKIRSKVTKAGLENRFSEIGNIADLFNDKAVHSASFNTLVINLANRSIIAFALLLYLFYLAPIITLFACLCFGIVSIPLLILNRRLLATSNTLSLSISRALSTLLLGVKNSLLLHIYGTTDEEVNKTQTFLRQYQNGYIRYFALAGVKGAVPIIFGVWFIGFLTFGTSLTFAFAPEDLVAFLYLFTRFLSSVSEVANISSQVAMTFPRARQLTSFLREFNKIRGSKEDETEFSANNKECKSDFPDTPFGVKLKDVSFNFEEGKTSLIDRLSLDVKPLSIVAIVGPSGVGKSTLLSLILGLQSPKSGTIAFYNNEGFIDPVAQPRAGLLSKIGYVGPENFIIPGSIRENLQYGTSSREDDALWRALELSQGGFVKNLPGGLDHRLTEQGEGLSAGQKQRLSIARAILRDPKFLILDEATSNMDAETEHNILEMLETIRDKMTMIVVTHRVAVLKIADIVVAMDESGLVVSEKSDLASAKT